MLAAELHAHTEHSHDGRDPVELLVAQAAAIGLDALAVTDHDSVAACERLQVAAAEHGILAIPGTEVSSAAGHVIALGVTERLQAGQSFAATAEAIHDAGGIVVVPHPFQASRSGVLAAIEPEPVIAHADAIEVYNSRLLTGRSNRRARRFAEEHDLPQTAGSDAHITEMIGQAVTRIDAPDDSLSAVLEAIAAGDTEIVGKRTPWRISLRQAAGGVRRRLARRMPGRDRE